MRNKLRKRSPNVTISAVGDEVAVFASRMTGLRPRHFSRDPVYRSLRERAMSYLHEYFTKLGRLAPNCHCRHVA